MKRTRILLVDLPRMLCEIVRKTIEDQVDMEVAISERRLPPPAELRDVDVVVTGSDDPLQTSSLLQGCAGVCLFALSAEGKETLLYELRPHRIPLGELSPRRLVNEIRNRREVGVRSGAPTEGEEVS